VEPHHHVSFLLLKLLNHHTKVLPLLSCVTVGIPQRLHLQEAIIQRSSKPFSPPPEPRYWWYTISGNHILGMRSVVIMYSAHIPSKSCTWCTACQNHAHGAWSMQFTYLVHGTNNLCTFSFLLHAALVATVMLANAQGNDEDNTGVSPVTDREREMVDSIARVAESDHDTLARERENNPERYAKVQHDKAVLQTHTDFWNLEHRFVGTIHHPTSGYETHDSGYPQQ
jgi:hypothetical protein